MGWALNVPASKSRFPDCVRMYLKAKFDLGERTGEKADSQQVALDMRNARNENGNRLFQRDQWLTKNHVKSFFSRLAAARRKIVATNDSKDDLASLSEIDDISGKGLTTSRAFFVGDVNIFGMRLLIQIRYSFVNNRKTILSHWDSIYFTKSSKSASPKGE